MFTLNESFQILRIPAFYPEKRVTNNQASSKVRFRFIFWKVMSENYERLE